jgi:hypothetical protein
VVQRANAAPCTTMSGIYMKKKKVWMLGKGGDGLVSSKEKEEKKIY